MRTASAFASSLRRQPAPDRAARRRSVSAFPPAADTQPLRVARILLLATTNRNEVGLIFSLVELGGCVTALIMWLGWYPSSLGFSEGGHHLSGFWAAAMLAGFVGFGRRSRCFLLARIFALCLSLLCAVVSSIRTA